MSSAWSALAQLNDLGYNSSTLWSSLNCVNVHVISLLYFTYKTDQVGLNHSIGQGEEQLLGLKYIYVEPKDKIEVSMIYE